jgi:hypothetical protein
VYSQWNLIIIHKSPKKYRRLYYNLEVKAR